MKKIENIIGSLGIVLFLTALIWYSITNVWEYYHWIFMVTGLAGIAWFLFDYFTKREKAFSGRSFKYGSNMAIQAVIFLAIVAMLAFVLTRQHIRWDLTENNLYSLSDQTEKVLSNLDKDVEVKGFFKSAEQNAARDLLDEYSYRSSRLTYEMIDPDEKPQLPKQYGIDKYNMLAVESGMKREIIEQMSEVNLTNAIIKVTREQDKVIYFLTGHGERSIKDESAEGYKIAVDAIKKENHLVRELNLVRRGSVPDSCTVLVIVRPETDLFPAEIDSIKNYLNSGGKVLLMTDPDHPQSLAGFLHDYNVVLGNDMVVDASGMGRLFGAGPGMPLVTEYDEAHVITKDFSVMTFFPYASSLKPMDEKGGYKITELLKTSPRSWAEVDYTTGEVDFDEGKDTQGPVTLGLLVEKDLAKGKTVLAAFGDSDFAMNGYFGKQGNGNLFLNTINYLAEEEDLISIRPKEIDDRRLTLTQADVSGLFYLVVIAIPLFVIVVGVTVFFKRNRA